MATQGPNSPSTVVSDNSYGSDVWSTPGNAAASDNSYATASITVSNTTEYLKATNFGFSIPAGATIDGIEVIIERRDTTAPGASIDDRVRIVKGGTIGTTDKSGPEWPASDTSRTYGGSSDKWGETWSVSDVNATTFGMALAVLESGTGGSPEVDHISITVHYTESGIAASRRAIVIS